MKKWVNIMKRKRKVAVIDKHFLYKKKLIRPDDIIILIKDYENETDGEAILAASDEHGKLGFVANSPPKVPIGCFSAGRIYDTFDEVLMARVDLVFSNMLIAEIDDGLFDFNNINITNCEKDIFLNNIEDNLSTFFD